jgi:tRNA (guanine37-N1)-methyltransferase
MRFDIVTLFPELFASVLDASLLGKARERGLVRVTFTNPRDHAEGKHRSTDDAPFGGGSGMVMLPGPLVAAIDEASRPDPPSEVRPLRVLLTPQGRPFDQAQARRLAALGRVVLVCGRYEGMDERVRESSIDEELSLGDFVLSGGELAALVVVDAVARLVPGVLGNAASLDEESFGSGLLEYPQYTRPQEFCGLRVPEVLLSGDHARIRRWRRAQMLARTRDRRPDLFARYPLSDEDRRLLAELDDERARGGSSSLTGGDD